MIKGNIDPRIFITMSKEQGFIPALMMYGEAVSAADKFMENMKDPMDDAEAEQWRRLCTIRDILFQRLCDYAEIRPSATQLS